MKKVKYLNWFILLLAMLLMISCEEKPTETETTGIISGTVLDATTTQPISNAMITTDPITSSKNTDSEGSYKIEGVEPGTYTVQASKNGYTSNTTTVNVIVGKIASADIQLTPINPELSVSTTVLDFGSFSSSLPFTISNSGMGTLDWNISENSSWITVNPTSGSITTEQTSITVNVDRSNLDAGDYSEAISISSNGGSTTIIVSMTVQGPILVVSNNSLNFGTNSETLVFNITNSGIGTLTWNVVFAANWLTINPTTGTTTTETDVITIIVDRTGLTYGNHYETVTITSNANSETIDILVTVANPNNPQLSAYPTTLDFSTNETYLSLYITNTGTGTLTWNIIDDQPWITENPTSGTTNTEIDEVVVTVDRLGLTVGVHSGSITISSNGGNQNISVILTIPDEPSLLVFPTVLDFGTDITTLTFGVSNVGTGDLIWSVFDNQEWINTNPTSGTNYSTINVTVLRDELTPGDYSGTITLSSNGGVDFIEIYMNVPEDEPPSPVELQVTTEITETSIGLIWTRNFDTDFAAYKLYRDLTPAVTQSSDLVTTITNSVTNYFTDTVLQPSTTYYYCVYVMDMAQQHTASNVVSGTTLTQLCNWSVIANLGTTFQDVDVLNENYIIAVGDNGKIFYYNGSSWSEESSPTTRKLYDVEIISQMNIWVVGDYYNDDGGILHYDGINWSEPTDAPDDDCWSIDAINENNIWIGSSSGKIHFYDGISWTTIVVNGDHIIDIQMDSLTSGWALDYNGKIFFFNGYGWSLQHDNYPGFSNEARAFKVFSSSNIWVCSTDNDNRIILWDGSIWNVISNISYDIYSLYALQNNSIWFVGDYGKIYYWNGNEIQESTSSTSNSIYSVKMISELDGWAVGDNGVVLRYH